MAKTGFLTTWLKWHFRRCSTVVTKITVELLPSQVNTAIHSLYSRYSDEANWKPYDDSGFDKTINAHKIIWLHLKQSFTSS